MFTQTSKLEDEIFLHHHTGVSQFVSQSSDLLLEDETHLIHCYEHLEKRIFESQLKKDSQWKVNIGVTKLCGQLLLLNFFPYNELRMTESFIDPYLLSGSKGTCIQYFYPLRVFSVGSEEWTNRMLIKVMIIINKIVNRCQNHIYDLLTYTNKSANVSQCERNRKRTTYKEDCRNELVSVSA